MKFYPRPSILPWKTEFAKKKKKWAEWHFWSHRLFLRHPWPHCHGEVSVLQLLSSGKPFMTTLSKAKKCHRTSERRVRKNIQPKPGSFSFLRFWPLELCPCHEDVQVMYRENPTQRPRQKAATIIESMRAHESPADLSFQITSFLPKSWTLSSSDKTFLVPSLGILTLRVYEHKKPLFCTTKHETHLLYNHSTWNNDDINTYFI